MKKIKRWMMLGLLFGSTLSAAVANAGPARTEREELIGAWRLVKIEITGPTGTSADPFYGNDSEGLLIYDKNGWFSVQIMGSTRPSLAVPERRPDPADEATRPQKVAALDSYYAYYGTWTFEPSTSIVTHHATGALYPAERNANYAQHTEVHGSKMTFTRTMDFHGETVVERKEWMRAVVQ